VCQIIYLGNEHVTRLSQVGIIFKSILSVSGSICFSECHFSTFSLTLSIPTYFFGVLNISSSKELSSSTENLNPIIHMVEDYS
jgi:hypothetical protein